MATHVLTDAALWLHDVAVHNLANTLEVSTSRDSLDDTRFGSVARTMRVGLFTAEVSASGMADMDGYDEALFDVYDGAETSPLSVAATADDGDVAYMFRSLQTTLQPLGGTVGELSAVSVEASGRGGVKPVRGRILHPETARTSSGDGTPRQLGSVSSSQTVYAALHVVSADGTSPTLDVTVESDDAESFGAPTTRLTFDQATGATAGWQSQSGAISDDWWRVAWTVGGTSPSFTFAVVVGIAAT